jgi:hypothetical protein
MTDSLISNNNNNNFYSYITQVVSYMSIKIMNKV